MNILEIPFIKLLGLKKDDTNLKIDPKKSLNNHIGTLHAGALYTLAETQSGLFLQEQFKGLKKDATPLLRSSTVTYKNPTTKEVKAFASIDKKDLIKFKEQFLKKSRASITVKVELKDSENLVIMKSEFKWYVVKLEIKQENGLTKI